MANLSPEGLNFKRWLFYGTGGEPGWRTLAGRFLFAQILVAVALALVVRKPLHDLAPTIVLPVSGVAVALAFAWGAASLPLLTSKAVRSMGKNVPGGLPEYANYFQLAILLVLITIFGWGFAAAGPYGIHLLGVDWGFVAKCVLFLITAITFTECYAVVDLARQLFLSAAAMEDARDEKEMLEAAQVKREPLPAPSPQSTNVSASEQADYVRVNDADR